MSFIQLSDLRQLNFETEVDFGGKTRGFDAPTDFGRKTSGFDRMVMTPNKAWGDDAFDAAASEDAPVPMDFDSLERWGMADDAAKTTPPSPAKPGLVERLTVPLLVGGLLALVWGVVTAPPELGQK